MSNFYGPWLADVTAVLVSMGTSTLFLKVWKPKTTWTSTALCNRKDNSRVDPETVTEARETTMATNGKIIRIQAWLS